MLSKAMNTSGVRASPTSTEDSVIFSYPQCHVVDKEAAGDIQYAPLSAYPDFGLIHLKTKRLPNREIMAEQVKLLIEIKRLYRRDKG